MAYQRQGTRYNFSNGISTYQFWLDRMELSVDKYLKEKIPGAVRDMNVRTFHSISYLDLQYLRDKLGGKVEVDSDARNQTMNVGDCCTLTFLEFGHSMDKDEQKDNFNDSDLSQQLEYKYRVNEQRFYLTNEVLLLKERGHDSHCPILVTIEPSDLSNQEKKNYQSDAGRKDGADKRKAEQKARKAKGKATASP